MKIKIPTKIKKPKKKKLVALEKDLFYYHKINYLRPEYLKTIVTRKEAEGLGYKPCDAGCYERK